MFLLQALCQRIFLFLADFRLQRWEPCVLRSLTCHLSDSKSQNFSIRKPPALCPPICLACWTPLSHWLQPVRTNPETEMLRVSTDKSKLDVSLIHEFLAQQSTWARDIPRHIVERAIENSLCFGGFIGQDQVAFARVISDCATFANLVDVFVLPSHRGLGYSKVLMQAVMAHPQLQGLRRFTLATSDAHALYAQFGFASPAKPGSLMERYFPALYQNAP